ncbi:2'-5' RNA ligase family protein [Microvirga sp. M2]|uniref:2'-5' RNA ligase family protein n=1 Tax=Microvirga sp. M2 TaxID=3073270 RepID=UPI0039C0D255
MTKSAPLILTLALDERSFAFLDEKRRRYFPPERNFIPAHLTLFHQLPGERVAAIQDVLERTCRERARFPLSVTGLLSLGRGVAYTLDAPELTGFRSGLAREWAPWLTAQDRQKHRPHVTVQNNVDPKDASDLLARLTAEFVPFEATGIGVDLWWYRGGPWEQVGRSAFR